MESFEEYQSLGLGQLKQLARLLRPVAARLLQEDMFACLKSLHGPFIMEAIRKL
jgi:hypothetical protein